ncbi:hypothetical protein LVD15_00850 [Fulvivirga maritima]|uniref:hypothetical protein n=1 Tax=Fulvivirga maritima TaxID=2904247 RepID=UPI001F1CC03A|nr:hypothetical protein [Fulvivirga maritima]UII27017.1 hypothetical protein LVD15_00850 [Fulvivirga maritima]
MLRRAVQKFRTAVRRNTNTDQPTMPVTEDRPTDEPRREISSSELKNDHFDPRETVDSREVTNIEQSQNDSNDENVPPPAISEDPVPAAEPIVQPAGDSMQARYNMLEAKNKTWMLFIDEKDHNNALGPKAYDGRPDGSSKRSKGSYASFIYANDYVSRNLEKKITVEEYRRFNELALLDTDLDKGWRNGEIEWGLSRVSDGQPDEDIIKQIVSLGLQIVKEQNDQDARYMVKVPKKRTEEVQQEVGSIFQDYYAQLDNARKEGRDAVLRLIANTYQRLEVLHAFQDGTSRSNHLVLNKLLVENSFNPAIIDTPNAPQLTIEQLVEKISRGMNLTRKKATEDLFKMEQNLIPFFVIRIKELSPGHSPLPKYFKESFAEVTGTATAPAQTGEVDQPQTGADDDDEDYR